MCCGQEWLRRYLHGEPGRLGGHGVYELSRQQLQRWHFVDGMTPTELQEKYRVECGVYAHRGYLQHWLEVLVLVGSRSHLSGAS